MTNDIQTGYRVLARKYRPDRFSELIGQDALVRTLGNALSLGRLAHAFVLTGVRGVGKTSTARLLARGLNCIGADGTGDATLEPCGTCEPCVAIAASRHVDVLEVDAASHTGVDDARDIIEGVGYRPVSARYKIYIIDEVHMMSKSAFNALLKTLEEPPDNVKFIFATTEIRKVPVTILSRCQRFDLRRVDSDVLAAHLASICTHESIDADPEALNVISRAAEGSVRDALSLLDQAAAMTADQISADNIAAMLGQPGRADSIAMLDAAMSGDAAGALDALASAHTNGAEPEMAIADLMDLIHRASLIAAGGSADSLLEAERTPVTALADMGIARLGRAWQMLLKGHAEITTAPQPMAAAEMLLIRLAHLANMPTPADIIGKLGRGADAAPATAPQSPPPKNPGPQDATPENTAQETPGPPPVASDIPPAPAGMSAAGGAAVAQPEPEPEPDISPEDQTAGHNTEQLADPSSPVGETGPTLNSLQDVAALAESHDEALLAARIRTFVRPVRLQPNLLEIALADGAPDTLAGDIARNLSQWTGQRWMVSLAEGKGGQTIAEARTAARNAQKDEIAATPTVRAVMDVFPGAKIEDIRPIETDMPSDAESDAPSNEDH
ncbi:MAG: DNA polymerase III subunit gamma/tau [Alphaproteobacteria bacterium]|nr:DNA polymerase III subunit gamma/tau [Alphaproteobacteria bacterium]